MTTSNHKEHKAVSLLKQIASIPSTTLQEQAVTTHLAHHLESRGWTVHLQPIAPSDPPRHNLYAFRSSGSTYEGPYRKNIKILFNSHLDTVPPHIAITEDAEKVYGRGTCDAKASVAAQICAVEEMIDEGTLREEDVGLLYVVGEETDHIGMIQANKLGLTTQYLIVGEPTELQIANGHKGMIKAEISAKGVAGHSGYPERGKSAIAALVDVLYELDHTEWPVDKRLGPTTFNMGTILGGVAANVIPADAHAQISFRLAVHQDNVLTQAKNIIERPRKDGVQVTCNVKAAMNPVYCETVDIPGVDEFTARYFTDIPYLTGSHKSLLFGPGTILVAHSVDEYVKKEDIVQAVGHYKAIVGQLLKV
ncbi:putative peptidase [Phlyctochytrium arcticum]|nr:putative peptidase [Phlyctochytrium arcticum]